MAEDEEDVESGDHKESIRRSKDNWITFFVANGYETNKDFLMDISDRTPCECNSLMSLVTHVWLASRGKY